jgi:hypothetical protein
MLRMTVPLSRNMSGGRTSTILIGFQEKLLLKGQQRAVVSKSITFLPEEHTIYVKKPHKKELNSQESHSQSNSTIKVRHTQFSSQRGVRVHLPKVEG